MLVFGGGACTRLPVLAHFGVSGGGRRGRGGLITASFTQTVAYKLPCLTLRYLSSPLLRSSEGFAFSNPSTRPVRLIFPGASLVFVRPVTFPSGLGGWG